MTRYEPHVLIFACHYEQRLGFKALVIGTEAVAIVILFDVHHLLDASHHFDGDIIVAAIAKAHQPSLRIIVNQVQSQITEGHGDDGIDGIRVAAPDEISEPLVNHIYFSAFVELYGILLDLIGDQVPDSP